MAETIAVEISDERARRLSHLHSVLNDLQWVQAACVRALRHVSDTATSSVITEALQASALMRYCRAFQRDAGTAFSLTADMLETLSPSLQQAHYEFYVLRDAYVAHSEDDRLWNTPTAHFQTDAITGKRRIAWLSVRHCSVISLSKESLGQLYSLALALVRTVRTEVKKEEALVLDMLKTSPAAEPETEHARAEALCELQ